MEKGCLLTIAVISLVLSPGSVVLAEEGVFEYPYYLLDSYNPDDDCWKGMDADGLWPVRVLPEQWLVGPPPSVDVSGVSLPTDHWVELKFRGRIVDGPGDDIFLVELDAIGEQALVFITDGAGQEYLLGLAAVPDIGPGTTQIGFDIADISLPFVPSAVRVLGIDLRGGSPGFDLAYVRARTCSDCIYIACNPSPADGVENVPADAILSWSPGSSAEKHAVYFGTSLSDVDANVTPVNEPAQPQDANSFDPGDLELGRIYYWRVDEFSSTDVNSPWTGNIWNFTVADHLVVDDFESYKKYEIHDVWTQTRQGYVYISKEPGPVHKCQQSMAFNYYYDEIFYSEAIRAYNPAQDWASAGVESLELFFHGKADNYSSGQMYLALSDGNVTAAVPYPGDANDLSSETWQLWRIDLQSLDVDLSHIEYISIGFSVEASEPHGSGGGTIFFDDIRLYPSRCLQENRPDGDFNADCAVGFKDLQQMTDDWLERGNNIYPVAAPNAPVAWYKFDGNAHDSAGSAHGHLRGSPAYVTGIYGWAISLDGDDDSVEIIDTANLFSKITTGITIAFWQYGTASTHHRDTLFCSNYTYGLDDPAIAINLGCWNCPHPFTSQRRSIGGKYNWDCGQPWSFDNRLSGNHRYQSEWSGRWNHWAFTKDAQAGKMQIFLNDTLLDSRTGATSPISAITSFEIGSGWYGGYDGLIDDFRIYDYALSQAEIAYVATNGTGIFDLPLMIPADLHPDNQINFIDFAILADNWLENQLWP
ncbi:MAG: LamG domain-containing protein [Planctomycetota bacterium]|jgi:hypothetical protein